MKKKNSRLFLGGFSFLEVFLLCFLSVSVYIYIGFYFPDPFISLKRPFASRIIVLGTRFLFPVVFGAICLAYYQIKKGKMKPSDIFLMISGVILACLLLYPVADHFYHIRTGKALSLHGYHPYLQLSPLPVSDADRSREHGISIFCLGGSTTEFRDDTGAGWPQRLETILGNESNSPDISVSNMGRQWYTTLHTLINYETNLRKYRPDVVIVMHAINDLLHNADFSYFSHGEFREDYGHFSGPVHRMLRHKSLIHFILENIGYFWYHEPRRTVEQTEFPGEGPFRRYIETLIDLADQDGTKVILMTQPSLYSAHIDDETKEHLYMLRNEAIGPSEKWSYDSVLRGFERYNAIIRDIARDRGVLLVDLEQQVPKNLDYLWDDVHYTKEGFDLVADVIAREIVRSHMLETISGNRAE